MRWAIPMMLGVSLCACTTWETANGTPREVLPPGTESTVRLLLAQGDSVTLVEAGIRNDAVVGLESGFGLGLRAVPLSDIRAVEIRRTEPWKTALVAVGAVLAGRILWLKLAESVDSTEPPVM